MAFNVRKITLVADTATEVYMPANRSASFKLKYVPVDDAADPPEQVYIAESEDALDNGDGWPLIVSGDFAADDLEFAPNESLWVKGTAAGALHILET